MKYAFNTWAYSSFPRGYLAIRWMRRFGGLQQLATTESRSAVPRRMSGQHT